MVCIEVKYPAFGGKIPEFTFPMIGLVEGQTINEPRIRLGFA